MKLNKIFIIILIFISSSYRSQVKISEVYFDSFFNEVYDNGEHHYGEFIEFYNRSKQDIDISGWSLYDNFSLYKFPQGTIIHAENYIVLANGPSNNSDYINNFATFFPQASGFESQILYQTNILLGNDEDFLFLKDKNGNTIDDIHYKTTINSQYGLDITSSPCFTSDIINGSSVSFATPRLVIEGKYSISLQRDNFDTNTIVQGEATPFTLIFTDNYIGDNPPNNGSNHYSNENYIYSRTYLEPTLTSDDSKKKIEEIIYFDGLGRPKQNIAIKANPYGDDLVIPIEYDSFGRQTKNILPMPIATKNGEIQTGVNEAGVSSYYNVTNAYSEKVLEDSPLNRVLQSAYPGDDWMKNSGHTVKYSYQANSATGDKVKKYETTTTWDATNKIYTSTLSQTSNFADNTLYKYVVTDENNNVQTFFKDIFGKVVLIRKNDGSYDLDTYYVYNEYNNLAFVIPPLAKLETTLSQPKLDLLCYQYRYDNKNRLIEKKLPNRGWEYYVYDLQDRLAASQDANMRVNNQWLFTKYDKFSRPIYAGITIGGTRITEQNAVDAKSMNIESKSTAVSFTSNGLGVYYTNTSAYPATINTLLTVNYYDEYPVDKPANMPTVVLGQNILSSVLTDSKSTKSLPTASYTKNIEDDNWTKSYVLYDEKSNPIYTHDINHLGGYTKTETKLDFSATPVNVNTYHKKLSTTTSDVVIKERFEYDHVKRIKKHFHQVNSEKEVLLSNLDYDDIGQVSVRKVGDSLQTVNYEYNIRGWLKSINDPNNLNNDLFGLIIRYNEPVQEENPSTAYLNDKVVPKYNGNISEVDWKTAYASNEPIRRYGYIYDGIDRLKAAYYNDYSNPIKDEFFEKITYDLNGNISTLKRSTQFNSTASNIIDDLAYTYSGNQLLTIADSSNKLDGYGSYDNVNPILYDANGNMISQPAKRISAINYNFLDLPVSVTASGKTGGTITFQYRADGTKLSKSYKAGTSPISTTEYLDGFQYKNNVLQFVPTAEGYYDFTNGRYVYQYKDQTGNVRVSYYRDSNNLAVIDKETNYYPLGLEHSYNPTSPANENYNYTYQSQEKQEIGDWLSFKWRNYDPTIGRFFNVDPLSEKYAYQSHYNFSENRLVDSVELEGLESEQVQEIDEVGETAIGSNGALFIGELIDNKVEAVGNIEKVDLKNKSAMPDLAMDENEFDWGDFAAKAGRFSLNFVPGVGSGLDIYEGIRDGNKVQVILGIGGLALDIATLGSASVAKGAIKTVAEEGVELALKEGAKELAEEGGELAVKEAAELAAKEGGERLIPLGLGTTGRTSAKNVVEQMAMKEAMKNPQLGTRIMEGMKDSRWLGWTKMEYKVKTQNGVNAVVHYVAKWEDGVIKAVDDFKFK